MGQCQSPQWVGRYTDHKKTPQGLSMQTIQIQNKSCSLLQDMHLTEDGDHVGSYASTLDYHQQLNCCWYDLHIQPLPFTQLIKQHRHECLKIRRRVQHPNGNSNRPPELIEQQACYATMLCRTSKSTDMVRFVFNIKFSVENGKL